MALDGMPLTEPEDFGQITLAPAQRMDIIADVTEQDGVGFNVEAGDFWRTPGGVLHGFQAGPGGARILDIFSPPREAYRKQGSGSADG